jgi:tetratricopeptide (TPR) repeat protein
MATDTAAVSRPSRTRPDPRHRLWQIPLFIIGVTAFVGTYQGWLPLGPRDPASAFRRDLAALANISEKPSPDLNDLKMHLARVAAGIDSFPEQAPRAQFALGSGYVRLAELTADRTESLDSWALARQHFERVTAEQLADAAEGVRLAYRAAKARAGAPWPKATQAELDLTRRLLLSTPIGEEPGEGHRLAAELGLRIVPPDLQQAKNSFRTYIAEAALATPPASIARAKLHLSEVHRQLNEIDEAKKWLSQIGPDAPPDVLTTAKGELARIRMAEGDYPGACREWQTLLIQPGLSTSQKLAATYFLGVSMLSNKDAAGAARRFEEVARTDGPESAAAAVRLADLRLRTNDSARHKEAAGLLALAVKGIARPSDYPKSALVPLNEVQAVFESAVQALTADGLYESAVAAAESYQAVAAAGRDREKRAETLVAWGTALDKAKGEAGPKFSAAAEEYRALAQARTAATDKADLLRKAANLFRQARNSKAAIETFQIAVKLPKLPGDVLGPMGIEYAETLLAVNRPEDALKVLQEVFLTPGPAATTARYRIARHLIDTRITEKVALGVELMDQIAKAETVSPDERDMHERALVDVAHAFIQRGNFAEAEARLDKQLKLYSTGPEAGLGKLLLGVCLLQRADPRSKVPAANPAKNREEALQLFKRVIADVEERAKADASSERDTWLRTQAGLRVLQTYQQMVRPYDVLKDGAELRKKVAGTADELIVMSLLYHAYKQLDKPENTLEIHGQMREVFENLKDKPGVFWAKKSEYSREYWEKVWFAPEPPKKP